MDDNLFTSSGENLKHKTHKQAQELARKGAATPLHGGSSVVKLKRETYADMLSLSQNNEKNIFMMK